MRRGGLARVGLALLSLSSTLAVARSALATYSIVAVDTTTREVGGAGTSCLDGSNVYVIYGSVPGTGVVHAQAQFSQAGRDRAVELLMQGTAPSDIITAIEIPLSLVFVSLPLALVLMAWWSLRLALRALRPPSPE